MGRPAPPRWKPALSNTRCDAAFSWEVAARRVLTPCREDASKQQLAHGRRRDSAAGDLLRHAITHLRDTVPDEHQVEPPEHRPVVVDEHVVGADASVLLCQQGTVSLGEGLEVLVAPVGDRRCEVGAVRQLEGQDRLGVVSAQQLQLRHRRRLSISRSPVERRGPVGVVVDLPGGVVGAVVVERAQQLAVGEVGAAALGPGLSPVVGFAPGGGDRCSRRRCTRGRGWRGPCVGPVRTAGRIGRGRGPRPSGRGRRG